MDYAIDVEVESSDKLCCVCEDYPTEYKIKIRSKIDGENFVRYKNLCDRCYDEFCQDYMD